MRCFSSGTRAGGVPRHVEVGLPSGYTREAERKRLLASAPQLLMQLEHEQIFPTLNHRNNTVGYLEKDKQYQSSAEAVVSRGRITRTEASMLQTWRPQRIVISV